MPILVNFGFVSAPDRGYDMTVRHQVQNHQRRGNIFYWRPVSPAQCIGGRNFGRHRLLSMAKA
ncbi:hypothetical protein QBD00_002171 [Ochrobactrum sp. AN78]|nr:hypothetical protein [Ochrobactrum sp. AN78]